MADRAESGLICPIDQRPLPGLDGRELDQLVAWPTWGAFNDAFADHALGHFEVSLPECEAIFRPLKMSADLEA